MSVASDNASKMDIIIGRVLDQWIKDPSSEISAALLNVVLKRTKELGLKPAIEPGSATEDLLARAKARMAVLGLDEPPPVDTETDDEATRS